jgi:predicted ATPase
VFVSSTLGELAAERAVVRAAVEQLRLIPVMFELGARPHPPQELYRAYLAQSQVFVGIYWERYGWVAPGESISGLEDEFRLSAGMPRLMYIKEPAPGREPRLLELLKRLEDEGTVSYRRFHDLDELSRLVLDDLALLLTERFAAAEQIVEEQPRPTAVAISPPIPLTETVGREEDLERVVALLRGGVRLLTLTGAGGIGKSRLALEVARVVASDFPDGVAFVPLESMTEPDHLLRALRERLQIRDTSGRSHADVLSDALAPRRMLLLLDNFEQLVEAAPDLGLLLDRCPGLVALVTSRQVLRLRAEHEYPLRPLASDAAVALFTRRAVAARPDFGVTDANRQAVTLLCERLDGLPLAIELAAARVRLLPPESLLSRLGQRLDLLSSGAADLPARQRTMRATLDWSYRLLDAGEQELLARLSVFEGGATLEAVEAICGDDKVPDVLGTLSSLLEKSLLISIVASDGMPRLHLLQVVKEYAAERLAERGDETARMRERHARWYADLAAPGDVMEHDDAHLSWPLFEAEIANLRAAGRWAAEVTDLDVASVLARGTWAFAWLTGRLAEFDEWSQQFLPALAVIDGPSRGRLLFVLGESCFMMGDLERARELIERSLKYFAETGDDMMVAAARMLRATSCVGLGSIDVGPDVDAAVAGAERNDSRWFLGYALSIRGAYRMLQGDFVGARSDNERSLAIAESLGLDVLVAQGHGQLVMQHVLAGDTSPEASARAHAHLREQFDLLQRTTNLEGLAYALDTAAGLALTEGRSRDAARALGTANAVRERLQMPPWPMLASLHEGYELAVRAMLGAEVADRIMAEVAGEDCWTVPPTVLGDVTVR